MEASDGEHDRQLTALVQRHQVCWEVHPVEAKPLDAERRTVGLEVTLAGVHDPQTHEDVETVRGRYEEVVHALRALAEDVTQHAGDPALRSLDIYDATVQQAPRRHHRPEASLKISILHPGERPDPLDDVLRGCLEPMEARLHALGASKGDWRPR